MAVSSRLAAVGTEPEGWAAAPVGGAPEAVFETVAAAPADATALLREVAAEGRRRCRTPAAARSRPGRPAPAPRTRAGSGPATRLFATAR
ncbi:hypothetical protein ACH4JS_14595 [Streptomyces sp. NPDC017638]|uniref:hypothetical protein n=1 Tax=Streptomyces sp. NPDC017638 TaxID=3365004 RepID=UPI0037948FB4